jgi:hypothetical protein
MLPIRMRCRPCEKLTRGLQMLLAPNAIGRADEIRQFAPSLRGVTQLKGVHVVSGRDCFDLGETRTLVPSG